MVHAFLVELLQTRCGRVNTGHRAQFGDSYDARHFGRIHSVLPHTVGPSRPVEAEGLRQLRAEQESKLYEERVYE